MRAFRSIGRAASVLTAGLMVLATPAFAQNVSDLESRLARDLTVAQKPLFELAPGANKIDVEAWMDNPSLTYAVGQPLRVMVRPQQDSYVTVVDVGSSGRVSVLYPNHFQRDAKVRAGAIVMIPSDRSSWQINVSGPAGIDLIKVFASRQPLTLPELEQLVRTSESNPVLTLGRSADELTRDLVAQLKPAEQAIGMRNLLIRVVDKGGVITTGAPGTAALQSGYGLTIRTDRPAYRVGEAVQLLVSTTRDCRLTIVSVGANGNAVQLFPNIVQRDNLVRATQLLMVPPPQSPIQIVARAPAGVEGVVAVCRDATSPAPSLADSADGGFFPLGTLQNFGRDLVASESAPEASRPEHGSTSYLVVE